MIILLSSCKIFRAVCTDETKSNTFKIFRRTNEECIGLIYQKTEHRWVYEAMLETFSSTDLMDIAALIHACRVRYTGIDYCEE